jgi:hypothetical protein
MKNKEIDIHKLIDEAMERKDKTVHIFISELGTTINVEPYEKEKDPEWIKSYREYGRGFAINQVVCSACGTASDHITPYCPYCGEKLKMPSAIIGVDLAKEQDYE